MNMNAETGKYIITLGVVIGVIGVLIYFFHDKLRWIGHLPGDIRIEKENFRFYFPVVTMIVFSVLLSVVAGILKRLF
jgi:membrane associated rhomboid family serine protease